MSSQDNMRIIGRPAEASNTRTRWERRYREGGGPRKDTPHPWLVEHAWRLPRRGRALDIACGMGRDALFLGRRGLRVHGIDFSAVALHTARERVWMTGLEHYVHFVLADLTQFAFPRAFYDVVIGFYYWEPSIMTDLKNAVKPGGYLIYETFNVWWKLTRPEIADKYLVRPGELYDWLKDWDVLAYRELGSDHPTTVEKRSVSSIVARRPLT